MKDQRGKDQRLIETLPTAFSRHRVVLGDDGSPADYIFLQVNTAFEQMTGLKRDQIIGKKVTEVLPGIEKSEFDWIDVYGKVAQGDKSLNVEQYSEPLKRWYTVQAYSDEPGYFTTVFSERTGVKQAAASIRELLKLTGNLIGSDQGAFDYQAAVNSLLGLSGAKFAAINTYEDDRTRTVTRAISGIPSMIERASDILGFEITGRSWDIQPERLLIIEGGQLIRFRSLFETSMGALSKTTAGLLQKLAGIGYVYLLELAYGGREPTGDIIFFMPKGKEIENAEAIELYAGQIGSLLARLRSEQKHEQKSVELDRYFNNSLDLLCVANTKGEFIRVNKRWEDILGYSAAELDGRPFLDFVHPDDMAATLEAMTTLDAQNEVINFKNRYLCSDGSYRWIEWRSKPQGEIIYAVARDVTDMIKAERELIDQKERLANIVEGAKVGTWEWNVQTGETIFNSKWAEIIGYTLEELMPVTIETWIRFAHPDDLAASNRILERHFKGEIENYDVECRMLHKDGHWVWVNDRGEVRSWTEDGKPLMVFGTHIDITARKQAEEALSGRLAFEEMIARVSAKFVNLPPEQIDEGINYALKNIGEHFAVDRSYLYSFSEDCKTYSITHQWHREEVEGFFEKNQNFPVKCTPWWISELKSGRLVNIADVTKMPDEIALDRADFLSEDIKSIFTLPLTLEGKVFGCFGFDTVKEERTWTAEQVDLLQLVAELITGAIARHDADRQIRMLSFHDQLTGLYNRRYFEHEMERLDCSREHPIAVISADLDGLKLINDTIGHSEGDRYLQAGGEVLKSTLRASDIPARVGGDEFALLLPRTDKVASELLVKRIRRKIDEYNVKQQGLPLSISLGLSVSESTDYPLEETYRMADNNMYTDKLQQGKRARAEIVSSLLASLFERGNLAEGEREQVQELAVRIGQALELPEDQLARLALFAQVYDLGKVGLPDSIIHNSMQSSAGNLTDAEREALHRHPESGYRIASSSPELADVAELILKHHENYDGTGYPLGLKGEAIPIECRILSVSISYSAMTNPRSYAETYAPAQALAELKRCAGSQFDPGVVEAFVKMMA